MSKAAQIMPRAPLETWGRSRSGGTDARPRFSRIRFTVRARSGAVSASVPSRSKRTACSRMSATAGAHQVIHVHVTPQRIHLGERIVGHAGEVRDLEAGGAAVPGELR